jgi:hypothetical protein
MSAMPQVVPALSESDFVVLTALAQAAEAVVLTRSTLPKTQRVVAELMAVITREREAIAERVARATLHEITKERELSAVDRLVGRRPAP